MLLGLGESATYISMRGKKYVVKNQGGKLVCFHNGKKCEMIKEIKKVFSPGIAGRSFTLYVGGVCISDPGGKGGYGVVCVDNEGIIEEYSGGYEHTTGNRMRIQAVIEGLSRIPDESHVDVYSESKFLVNTLVGRYRRNRNKDLWDKLDTASEKKRIRAHEIKGKNELLMIKRCEELAMKAVESGVLSKDPTKVRANVKKTYTPSPSSNMPKPAQVWDEAMDVPIEVKNDHVEQMDSINSYCSAHKVTEVCAQSLNRFWRSGSRTFDDYALLKVGGRDIYSSMGKDALAVLLGEEDIDTAHRYLDDVDALAALRWHARGLSLHDSIRKILVDNTVWPNKSKPQKRVPIRG